MAGKSIRIFLVDGTASGLATASIGQWTGVAVVAARTRLDALARRPEARRPSVYVLEGADAVNPSRRRVYVGETDSFVDNRQRIHDVERDFWERVVIFTSTDENLTKAHTRYVEARLLELARDARRATIDNTAFPAVPALPEADRSDMEVFLSQMLILLPVLGLDFASVLDVGRPDESVERVLFELRIADLSARARLVDDEFVVLKGSHARRRTTDSCQQGYRRMRAQLIEEGVLAESASPELLEFHENVPFRSPSAAAAVVYGNNMNGRETWKVASTGQTYGEWEDAQLALSSERASGRAGGVTVGEGAPLS